MYIEEYEKKKKEGPSYNTKNTNVYDYAFPNLTKNLVQKDYKKYNFEKKMLRTMEEMNPFVDLSNEVSVIIERLNPKIRTVPEHFIKDVLNKIDISTNISKQMFSRRKRCYSNK